MPDHSKMLVHYFVSVSHFAKCCENRRATVWEMPINLLFLKSPIPQWWWKCKSDPKSVSRIGSTPKVNQFFRSVAQSQHQVPIRDGNRTEPERTELEPTSPLLPMQLGGLGSAVSSPSGVRGRAPTTNVFCSYWSPENVSGGSDFCFVAYKMCSSRTRVEKTTELEPNRTRQCDEPEPNPNLLTQVLVWFDRSVD